MAFLSSFIPRLFYWAVELRSQDNGLCLSFLPNPSPLFFLRVNLFIHDGNFLFYFCTFLFLGCLGILFLYSFCWIVHFLMIWRLPFSFIQFFLHSTVYAFAKNTFRFLGILFSLCFEYPISLRSNFMECLPGPENKYCCIISVYVLYGQLKIRIINNESVSTNQSATTSNE